MRFGRRAFGVLLGLVLILHGLANAVLPLRGIDVAAPGILAPSITAMYVIAIAGFVAAGLGVWGVRPMSSAFMPLAVLAGVGSLLGLLRQTDVGIWLGVSLNSVLMLLTVVYASTAGEDRPPRHTIWRHAGDAAGLAFLAWVATAAAVWPWSHSWGTTPEEWTMALPGDHAPRTPQFEILHGVTIAAPPSEVWPWLVQIGQDRAGFYSYDWLERLFATGIHNAATIRPEWQSRAVGEMVYATPPGYLGGIFGNRPGWTITTLEPERALVLKNWGAFVLLPMPDGGTRFLIRSTISNERIPAWAAAINLTAFELPHFIMQRRMMLGIKELAERTAGSIERHY